jgi:hypothetical protein
MYYSPANAGPMVGLPERLNHHLPVAIAMVQYLMMTGCSIEFE